MTAAQTKGHGEEKHTEITQGEHASKETSNVLYTNTNLSHLRVVTPSPRQILTKVSEKLNN